jgi:hypothetical protein
LVGTTVYYVRSSILGSRDNSILCSKLSTLVSSIAVFERENSEASKAHELPR